MVKVVSISIRLCQRFIIKRYAAAKLHLAAGDSIQRSLPRNKLIPVKVDSTHAGTQILTGIFCS